MDWVVVGSVVDRFAFGYSARPIARACTSYIAVSVKYYVLNVSPYGKANCAMLPSIASDIGNLRWPKMLLPHGTLDSIFSILPSPRLVYP